MAFRLLNRSGKFNIESTNNSRFIFSDIYHTLLSINWIYFTFLFALVYVAINIGFATLYYLCGQGGFIGLTATTNVDFYIECFFFSVQTIATIGYGRISPVGLVPNILVTFEAFFGLFGLAIITGLLFSRFSRPTARVVFSHYALFTTHNHKPCLMFRMANARLNQIVEARVSVIYIHDAVTSEGQRFRTFHHLKLLREISPAFALSWTVIHPIDDDSPLKGLTKEDLIRDEGEIFVTLAGIDDTFSQTITSRHSYIADEILWNHRFKDIAKRVGNKVRINIDEIHHTHPHTEP